MNTDRDIWFIFDNGGGVTVYDRGAGYAHTYNCGRCYRTGDCISDAQHAAADALALIADSALDCHLWDGNDLNEDYARQVAAGCLTIDQSRDHPSSASVAIDDVGAWLATGVDGASFADQFGGGDVAENFADALKNKAEAKKEGAK